MKEFYQKNSTSVALIVFIILLVLGYVFFIKGNSKDTEIVSVSDTDMVGAQVIAMLQELQSIKLKGDLFDQADYQSLKDDSLIITNHPVGRANPFIPISNGVAAVTTAPAPKIEVESTTTNATPTTTISTSTATTTGAESASSTDSQ